MSRNQISVSFKGVGWNISKSQRDNRVILNVGYSHPVKVRIPSGLEVIIRSETTLKVKGDKQIMGDFVASLIRIRPWNVYTGHGIIRMDRTEHLIQRGVDKKK